MRTLEQIQKDVDALLKAAPAKNVKAPKIDIRATYETVPNVPASLSVIAPGVGNDNHRVRLVVSANGTTRKYWFKPDQILELVSALLWARQYDEEAQQ